MRYSGRKGANLSVTVEIKEIRVQTDELLSVPEAARQLGKHKMTLYRWIDASRIAYIKLGGILFIPRSEVRRLRKENHRGENSPVD